MAEFHEVMRQYKRMTKLWKENGIEDENIEKGESDALQAAFSNPDWFEDYVMRWAKEHPEETYPNRTEWWKTVFRFAQFSDPPCWRYILPEEESDKLCEAAGYDCTACKKMPIPHDIAQKLCIQPICNKSKTPLTFAFDKVANAIKVVAGEQTHQYKYEPGGKLKSSGLWIERED